MEFLVSWIYTRIGFRYALSNPTQGQKVFLQTFHILVSKKEANTFWPPTLSPPHLRRKSFLKSLYPTIFKILSCQIYTAKVYSIRSDTKFIPFQKWVTISRNESHLFLYLFVTCLHIINLQFYITLHTIFYTTL